MSSILLSMERIIEIAGLGPISFERSKRARRLNITVSPSGGVRVAIPRRSSLKEAEQFVREKTDWIRVRLDKIESAKREYEALTTRVNKISPAAARRKLLSRLSQLADEHGFAYNRVYIRNQTTRWGSCSGLDNISLNAKLAVLPEELIDYVILHELVHTRVKDHSPAFWAQLDKYVGDAKAKAAKLRDCGLALL